MASGSRNGYYALPGSAIGVPPSLLGPTGNVYIHGDGQAFSTHLTTVLDHPSGTGFANVPLLVPGQVGIEELLNGKHPTGKQIAIARRWASTQTLPQYENPAAAEAADKQMHDELAPKVGALVRPFLGPMLPQQNQPPAVNFKP